MKIKSIKAGVHRLSVTVPLLKEPIVRNAVVCEVETDDGYTGSGLTGGAYLPFAIVTAIEKEFLPLLKDMDPRDTEAIHERRGARVLVPCPPAWRWMISGEELPPAAGWRLEQCARGLHADLLAAHGIR